MKKILIALTALCALVLGSVGIIRAQPPSGSVPAIIVDHDGDYAPVHSTSGLGVVSIDFPHFKTHTGDHYQTSIQNTLGDGGIVNTIINTPSASANHLLIRMDAQGEIIIEFYRAPTCSSLGSLQASSNMNDISSNTASTEIYLTPTCSSNGTLIPGWTQKMGSGKKVGGETYSANEHILRLSTLYMIKITSGGASNEINHVYDFYEESWGP